MLKAKLKCTSLIISFPKRRNDDRRQITARTLRIDDNDTKIRAQVVEDRRQTFYKLEILSGISWSPAL